MRCPSLTVSGEELRTLKGHTARVMSVSFSPDGQRIVSGNLDNTIKVWDAESGAELRTLKGHHYPVASVSFSPDGRRIVSGSWDETIKIWDAESDEEQRTLTGHTKLVIHVWFSPDGEELISEDDQRTQIVWSTKTWERLEESGSQPHTSSNRSTSTRDLSPDGRWLVLSIGKEIRVIDLHYKQLPRVRKFRKIRARPNPAWHQEQTKAAAEAGDLFAELFHHAWKCKINPEDMPQLQEFHELHKKFLKANEQTDPIIPKVVIEALAIPIGVHGK